MEALIAALCVSLLSLSGILLFRSKHIHEREHSPFLPLSIGAFLGVTFFELLPEAFHETDNAPWALALGFLGFFFLSRVLREYHHHHHVGTDCDHGHSHTRSRGALVLLGDSVHNVADGIVIATAFSVSTELGIATTLGIALHEVPQEVAELYILVRAGYTKAQALFYNFLSALTIIVGVVITNTVIAVHEASIGFLIAIAAGNLLYIAASDLLPTLSGHGITRRVFVTQSIYVLVGLCAIALLLQFALGAH